MPWAAPDLLANLPAGVALVAGGLLLLFGRRLFWLTVGFAGFLLGFGWGSDFGDGDRLAPWLVGLVIGVVAALLAVLVVKIAVGLAGFLVGGWALAETAVTAGWVSDERAWVVALAGGLAAGILAGLLFEAALVGVSALLGAGLVAGAVGLEAGGLAWLLLAAAGVAVQVITLRRRPPRPLPPARRAAPSQAS